MAGERCAPLIEEAGRLMRVAPSYAVRFGEADEGCGPQLNKAIARKDKLSKGDINLKVPFHSTSPETVPKGGGKVPQG